MKTKIINYIRAGYPGLYLVSPEEQRVEAEMHQVAKELEYHLFAWSVVDGLVDSNNGKSSQANDPLEALIAIQELKEKSIVLLRDFHQFLQDPNPILIRQLKNVLQEAKTQNKTLIILGCRLCLPPELEHELTVVEFALPGKEQLRSVLGGIMESAGDEIARLALRERRWTRLAMQKAKLSSKLTLLGFILVTPLLQGCVAAMVMNSQDRQHYSEYVTETQKINLQREMAKLTPERVMTFQE
jgi:hypothetical protein